MSQNLNATVLKHLEEAVSRGVMDYLSVSPEDRHKLEKDGKKLHHAVFQHVAPIINSMKIKTVLVAMDEGIGNMVMLTPALRLLRDLNPRLEITVLCSNSGKEVIKNWDVIDHVITEIPLDEQKVYDITFLSIWSNNTKQKYHGVLQEISKGVVEIPMSERHESILHNNLFEFLDNFPFIAEPHCDISTGDEAAVVDEMLKEEGVKEFIIFSDTTLRNFGWDRKRWPHYQELAKLMSKKDLKIVLVGDEQDREEAIKKEWAANVSTSFIGKLSIPQLAYLCTKCSLFLGNDSGPAHIAAAVGAKTYVLFGPTRLAKNKPIGKDVHILSNSIACSPCQYTEMWANCSDYQCMSGLTAQKVYKDIFHPDEKKEKVLLVGSFAGGALRNELYIKDALESVTACKVFPCDYRAYQAKMGPVDATYMVVNDAIKHNVDKVLICGGQSIVPECLSYLYGVLPNVRVANWYVDNRGGVEEWFYRLSSVCHDSYWSTGDPIMLSQVFSQSMKPCEFLPIVPSQKHYYPMGVEKDIDVLFCGTPHSKDRVELLEYLVDNGVNISIYGDENGAYGIQGKWSDKLKPYVKPGVYGNDFNKVLNRAKVVVNQNIINTVSLYFSDRYFYPMATKTVGVNFKVPKIEDMFEDGKHMYLWSSKEECLAKIKYVLSDYDKNGVPVAEAGYGLYKEKYRLEDIIKTITNNWRNNE